MRHVLAVAVVWLAGIAPASAQVSERLDVSAIVRTDRVSFEGHQNARLPVAGVGVSYRVWRDMRIEGEVTTASGESRRAYLRPSPHRAGSAVGLGRTGHGGEQLRRRHCWRARRLEVLTIMKNQLC